MRIFEKVLFFQSTYNIKKQQQTNKQSIHLAYVSSMLGCWRKYPSFFFRQHPSINFPFLSANLPASNLPASNFEIDCLFFCFYVVRSLEKESCLENSHVLSCFVQLKKAFSLASCALWIHIHISGYRCSEEFKQDTF